MLAASGDTVTARRTAGRTVTAAVPSMDVVGSVAVMVVAPVATAVTSPCEPELLETVAVPELDDRPGDRVGQVLCAPVGVVAGRGELLGLSGGDVCDERRHRHCEEHRRKDGDRCRSLDRCRRVGRGDGSGPGRDSGHLTL